jgi:hypothetical protein
MKVNFVARRQATSVQVAQKLVNNFTDMHDEASRRVPYAWR